LELPGGGVYPDQEWQTFAVSEPDKTPTQPVMPACQKDESALCNAYHIFMRE
jgi:hypothetical protein